MQTQNMPDVQSSKDLRATPIQKVGVRGVKYPIIIKTGKEIQHSVGNWTMTVYLPAEEKGTHMSRFLALLEEHDKQAMNPHDFMQLTEKMKGLLQSQKANIKVTFPYFMQKVAPVSGVTSPMDYEVTWHANVEEGVSDFEVTVVVPVMSLCPCSKAISKYGAHNQRSYITVTLGCSPDLDLDELIRQIEAQGSCQLWGLLKRPDEKYVTEHSYDNPKFVEDLIRDVAVTIQSLPSIRYYHIEVENLESIHNHSAYASISG
ncbi:GTP cyclohydrolase FolE2 [Basilea psittacipulmonis]|uniref:GTP cyclohydrolase FolE2 n=1 Tax=Basilea psittacipulmonis DSM 24701 TaxID=1072685 RepID=A0A077DCA8_9BURK|nr:GTP cyclohydrolase FolE2 [Basilea psittacipulmonis]AIL32530.1 GTP cyclohydrolase [Basilea psittacipulmonis DSM 24701]